MLRAFDRMAAAMGMQKNDPMEEKRQKIYQALFASEEGQFVLNDLKATFGTKYSCIEITGTPDMVLYVDGQHAVLNHIFRMIGVDR